ncbi:MAG: MotE family protein [Candidatus Eiseniibacteriota bacterium]
MTGTDVAEKDAAEGKADAAAPKAKGQALAFLRVWLPFPVILGGILLYQLKFAHHEEEAPVEEDTASIFEGAGAELPLLVAALEEERAALQQEWEALRFAEERALITQSEIGARKVEVEDLLARVEAKVSVMEEERGVMLEQLARVYETMKPDAAAEILQGIDVETSTEIIRRMKERNAASVMASLEPRSAAKISQRMLRP